MVKGRDPAPEVGDQGLEMRGLGADRCLHLFNFPQTRIVLLTEAPLQSLKELIAAPIEFDAGLQRVVLEVLEFGVELLAHAVVNLVGQALGPYLNHLQFLCRPLLKFVLGGLDVLFDGCFGGGQHLFGLLAGLHEDQFSQFLAQANPQLLFEFGRNLRQRDFKAAALGLRSAQFFSQFDDFGTQRPESFLKQRAHPFLPELLLAFVGHHLQRSFRAGRSSFQGPLPVGRGQARESHPVLGTGFQSPEVFRLIQLRRHQPCLVIGPERLAVDHIGRGLPAFLVVNVHGDAGSELGGGTDRTTVRVDHQRLTQFGEVNARLQTGYKDGEGERHSRTAP